SGSRARHAGPLRRGPRSDPGRHGVKALGDQVLARTETRQVGIEYIRTLYRYSAWANERILDTAAGLAPAQLTKAAGASFGSVRDTLVHIMHAQWIWLHRWKGVSPRTGLHPDDFPDLDAIRTRWTALEQETREFVEAVGEAELARVIGYTNTKGEQWAYPLWQMLIH